MRHIFRTRRWRYENAQQTRKKDKFLLFPKKFGDEWRWLERIQWTEVLRRHGCCGICGGGETFVWEPVTWSN